MTQGGSRQRRAASGLETEPNANAETRLSPTRRIAGAQKGASEATISNTDAKEKEKDKEKSAVRLPPELIEMIFECVFPDALLYSFFARSSSIHVCSYQSFFSRLFHYSLLKDTFLPVRHHMRLKKAVAPTRLFVTATVSENSGSALQKSTDSRFISLRVVSGLIWAMARGFGEIRRNWTT